MAPGLIGLNVQWRVSTDLVRYSTFKKTVEMTEKREEMVPYVGACGQ